MAAFDQEYFDRAYAGAYRERNPLRKLRYYLREIRRVRPLGSLLDIGCAYGLFLAEARKYYTVTGADVSAAVVAEARKTLPGTEILQAGLESLPADRQYTVVTCFDVLEHVEDLDGAFGKLRGLLKEGGIIALTVPVYDTPAGALVRLLDRDETHRWKKGRRFWREKLAHHGFSLLVNHGLWRYSLFGRFYLFWGGRLWRGFSPAILLIGEKA